MNWRRRGEGETRRQKLETRNWKVEIGQAKQAGQAPIAEGARRQRVGAAEKTRPERREQQAGLKSGLYIIEERGCSTRPTLSVSVADLLSEADVEVAAAILER